jgi:uncharacterized membrane protein YvbJ
MNCKKCGAELNSNPNFCNVCGTPANIFHTGNTNDTKKDTNTILDLTDIKTKTYMKSFKKLFFIFFIFMFISNFFDKSYTSIFSFILFGLIIFSSYKKKNEKI